MALWGQTNGAATRDCTGAMRACNKITVHDLDRRGGPRDGHEGQQRRTAAIGRSRRSRERKLGRCGSTVKGCASRRRQAGGRASRPTGSQGGFLGLSGVPGSRGVEAARVVAWDSRGSGMGRAICVSAWDNMNGPGRFRRAANKAGVTFHVASDGELAGACEARAHLTHKEATTNTHETANRQAPHGPAAAGRARESTRTVKADSFAT